jgi:ABC-type glycerol-3-phosphate transport system permease component
VIIKKFIKHIISHVLTITVLLPFAVQFLHAFEHHEQVCTENKVHIDHHKVDCSVFHFKINHNAIDFSSEEKLVENTIFSNIINTAEAQLTSANPQYKSSRAPPVLLF